MDIMPRLNPVHIFGKSLSQKNFKILYIIRYRRCQDVDVLAFLLIKYSSHRIFVSCLYRGENLQNFHIRWSMYGAVCTLSVQREKNVEKRKKKFLKFRGLFLSQLALFKVTLFFCFKIQHGPIWTVSRTFSFSRRYSIENVRKSCLSSRWL